MKLGLPVCSVTVEITSVGGDGGGGGDRRAHTLLHVLLNSFVCPRPAATPLSRRAAPLGRDRRSRFYKTLNSQKGAERRSDSAAHFYDIPFFGGQTRVIKCTPDFPIFSPTLFYFPPLLNGVEVTFHCSAAAARRPRTPTCPFILIFLPQLFHSPILLF